MRHTTMILVFLLVSISIAHSAGDLTGEWVGVKGKSGMCRMRNNVSISKRGGKYLIKNSGGYVPGTGKGGGGYMECLDSVGIVLSYEDQCLVDKSSGFTACLEKGNLIINFVDGEFIYAKAGASTSEIPPPPSSMKAIGKQQTQEISPTFPPSKNGRFPIKTLNGDVLVKDFRKAENFIGNEENKYFAWNIAGSDYCHIAFDGNVSIFQVSVFSANPNFNIALKEAGKFFLKTLEIKESDACKIHIQITPGVTSNFENAPKDYWNHPIKFSFCK